MLLEMAVSIPIDTRLYRELRKIIAVRETQVVVRPGDISGDVAK